MTQQDIYKQAQKELTLLLETYGTNCIEFGITASPLPIYNTVKRNSKITFWYSLGIVETQEIYLALTEQFKLPYDNTLRGQYLYILLKCWDKIET